MSRSLSGSLLGKAAQTAARELREFLYSPQPKGRDYLDICDEILSIMGEDEYSKWIETTPEDNAEFNAACVEKLAELEQLRIRDEMVQAVQPTILAMKSSLIAAGDGDIAEPTVPESVQAELNNDDRWLRTDDGAAEIVSQWDDILNPDGSDTSMAAQLRDSGYGEGGPF